MKRVALLLLLFVAFQVNGLAQVADPGRFSLIGMKEGLSSSQINDLVQDSLGFLWVATNKGLNRYDGKNIIQFFSDSGNNSLPVDNITKLKLLPGNLLAACTVNGLYLLNLKTLAGRTVVIPADSLLYEYKVNVIIDVEGDESGNLFIITRSGFYMLNSVLKLQYRYDHYSREEANTKSFAFGFSVIRFSQFQYILCTEKGQWIFDSQLKKIIEPPAGDLFLKTITRKDHLVRSLYRDKLGIVALLKDKVALEYYDLKRRTMTPITIPSTEMKNFDWRSQVNKINDSMFTICGKEKGFYFFSYRAATGNFIFDTSKKFTAFNCRAVWMAADSRLWVASSKGLFKGRTQYGSAENIMISSAHSNDSAEINFRMVNVIKDKIYAGSSNGLYLFNRTSGSYIKHFDFSDITASSKHIYHMLPLNDDTLLVGSNGPLIVFNPSNLNYGKATLPGWNSNNWITAMSMDRGKNLFIASNAPGVVYIKRRGEMFQEPEVFQSQHFKRLVRTVFIKDDPDGNVWFAGHGASRYQMKNKAFDFRIDSFPGLRTNSNQIETLEFDSFGKLYIGTAFNGLLIYDINSHIFKQLGRSNGLPDNQVKAIYRLGDILWIGTPSGIATYNIKTHEIVSYGNIDDEKPEIYFTGYRFYYDSVNRRMYAPCNNSILRFDPASYKKRRIAPVFFIESITINSRETIYHPSQEIELNPGEKNLLFAVSIVNYEDALQERLFYRFRNESDWQSVGSQRSLLLSNLSDGVHQLEFMLTSKSNSWKPQVIPLNIYIKHPFWKAGWFVALSVILLLSLLWLLYKARINRIRQKASIDSQLAELEMKSLHAQMNPHFIFNALNSIKEMIWENDKHNASKYLSKFAQLIRTTLDQSRQNFITVKQCVLHLEQYLEMEKIRFEDFHYSIENVDQVEWDEVRMAPMLVQPLVENAIWHGLKNIGKDKQLVIRFYTEAKHIVCEIEDNGPGINHQESSSKPITNHRSISIENIRSRLQMLNEKYNMSCSLEFIDKADIDPAKHGTIAILRLST